MARTQPYNQECPIARTLDVIGDRWTLLIIRDLFLGKGKFSEFRHSTPSPPPRLLAARLKRLAREGIVERTVYSEHPLRAEYRLTPKGRSLFPVIFAMGLWGFDHLFTEEPELKAQIDEFLTSKVPEYAPLMARATAAKGD